MVKFLSGSRVMLQVAQISDLFKKLIGNKIATLIDIDDTVLREEQRLL